MTSFIYPVVVSATWGGGWLASEGGPGAGYMDFAGSGTSDDFVGFFGQHWPNPNRPGSVQCFFAGENVVFLSSEHGNWGAFMSKLEMFRQIQQVLDSLNFYHDSFGWAFLVLGTPSPYLARWAPQWCERWLIDRMIEDASSTNHSSPSCNPNLASYLNCCFH